MTQETKILVEKMCLEKYFLMYNVILYVFYHFFKYFIIFSFTNHQFFIVPFAHIYDFWDQQKIRKSFNVFFCKKKKIITGFLCRIFLYGQSYTVVTKYPYTGKSKKKWEQTPVFIY